MMDQRTLDILGYGELLKHIAGYAQGTLGARAVLALKPSARMSDIVKERGIYEDMLSLFETAETLPSLRVSDISEYIVRLQPTDAILSGDELVEIRCMLEIVWEIVAFFKVPEHAKYGHLMNLCSRLNVCQEGLNKLRRCFDEDGQILDSASPELHNLRREIANCERRLQRMLDDILKDDAVQDMLQERFVTQRNGRFVVPVKRDARGQLTGLVHDMSSTGQTIFIEPAAVVPIGNELTTLRLREREEVRSILKSICTTLRNYADDLLENLRIVGHLDGAAAVARWAVDYGCAMPAFGDVYILHQARHPLLLKHLREEAQGRCVIPLDLELPKQVRALVITGSNTGGKTVALKTAGLLALCAQSGLPVPAAKDSLFTVFDHILADVGDEQSMTANLSTFSGHLAVISKIIETSCEGRSLILLDELGAGTDPMEGGALACGILAQLVEFDSMTLATTHLGVVKNYVHSRKDMLNGAVRFNVETLQPEYVLDIGRPGASHAMHIAKRAGLPAYVFKEAEKLLSGDQLHLEDMLQKLEKEQQRLAQRSEQVALLKKEWHERHSEVSEELADLRKKRKELMNEAYQRAESMVDNTRRDLENLVRRIREAAKMSDKTGTEVNQAIADARRQLEEHARKLAKGKNETSGKLPPALTLDEFTPGRKIWVERLQAYGRIKSVAPNKKSAIVEINGLNFTMKSAELFKAQEPDTPASGQSGVTRRGGYSIPRVAGQTCHEINCVGMRVEDAIAKLQNYLNDCVLAGLEEVRIVHGFGTGRLRDGIHAWLRRQGEVSDFRLGEEFHDAGGGGVTIVQLVVTGC